MTVQRFPNSKFASRKGSGQLSRSIRVILNLSQTQLALLLGCSRSIVSMAELGERELPANATEKFTLLIEQLAASSISDDEETETPSTESRETFDKIKTDLTIRLYQLRKRLDRMKTEAEQSHITLATLDRLEQLPSFSDDAKQLAVLQNARVETEQQLKRCGRSRQILLESELVGVQSQLDWIEEQIGKENG